MKTGRVWPEVPAVGVGDETSDAKRSIGLVKLVSEFTPIIGYDRQRPQRGPGLQLCDRPGVEMD